jgi:high-affinity nickel permease
MSGVSRAFIWAYATSLTSQTGIIILTITGISLLISLAITSAELLLQLIRDGPKQRVGWIVQISSL